MTDALALIGAFSASALVTFAVIPWIIPKLRARGIVGRDLNKPEHPEIAEMGGVAVLIGVFIGIGVLMTFDGIVDEGLLGVSLSVVLGVAFIGMIDDLFDLRQRQKAFFPFLLALPLGASLDPVILVPYVGYIDFGALMVLAAPFAITCAANAGNMLEGFNGLGAGLGIIMSATMIALAFLHGRLDGLFMLVPLLGGLTAFLWFNKYPARVFPGDTLMFFMGATLAAAGMLSSLYIQTFLIFLPMIAEFLLKLRGLFEGENYCTRTSDGHLEYSGRTESLTHVLMKNLKLTERQLVAAIWAIEGMICGVVLAVDFAI